MKRMLFRKLVRLPHRAWQKTNAKIHYLQNTISLKRKYRFIPDILYLEVTNKCNANCVFCARKDTHKPLMDMDLDLFKRLVDAAPYTTQVHTQGFGEPLLYPYLVEAIQYCKDRGKRVVFYTNASLLTDDIAIRLLDTGVDQIRFSVDEITKESYESLRRGLVWDVVLENIENFHKRKKEGKYKTETIARICATKENKLKMSEITKFWSERVDVVVVKPEVNIPSYSECVAVPFIDIGERINCPNPYTELAVKSNGDVVLCCSDWFHNYVITNIADAEITQEMLLDIFNSEEYNVLRQGLETGMRCPARCPSCQGMVAPKR